ncbi:MAG: hypothetical protein SGPRY_010340 [Prymnesium sp.]
MRSSTWRPFRSGSVVSRAAVDPAEMKRAAQRAQPTRSCRQAAAPFLAEQMISMMIAACVASAWRGAWLVLDVQFLTYFPTWSAAVSLVLGAIMMIALSLLKTLMPDHEEHQTRFCWRTADALYSYAGLWCCVLFWRGVWQLWCHSLGEKYGLPLLPAAPSDEVQIGALFSHGIGVMLLFLHGSMRSLNAPPMIIVLDSELPFLGARTAPGLKQLISGFSVQTEKQSDRSLSVLADMVVRKQSGTTANKHGSLHEANESQQLPSSTPMSRTSSFASEVSGTANTKE